MNSFHGLGRLALVVAGCWLAGFGAAEEPSSAWKQVQSVQIPKPGWVKLNLPGEMLDAARPGLEDLRVFDPEGRETPFFVERLQAPVQTSREAVAFQTALTSFSTVITFRSGGAPVDGVTLASPSSFFHKAVQVEASTDGKQWKILARGQPIFRLPGGAERLRLDFQPGGWEWMRLTVDDHREAPVAFSGARVHVACEDRGPLEPLPVRITEREESPDQTRLMIDWGAANVTPSSLVVETPETVFTRHVTLATRQLSGNTVGECPLAHGTIHRVEAAGQPLSTNLALSVEVAVPWRGGILLIQNDSSPPLRVSGLRMYRRPVYAVFLARQAGTYRLLTGNPLCPPPRYDLTSLGAQLKGTAVSPLALSPLTANPDYRVPEVLPEMPDLGTPLDTAAWKYRKAVKLDGAGVRQLDLDLDVLSHANRSFSDLRLVRDGRQHPYLLEPTSIQRSIELAAVAMPDSHRPGLGRWELRLPRSSLPVTRLICSARTRIFQREMALWEEVPDERGQTVRRFLGQSTWTRTLSSATGLMNLVLQVTPSTNRLILETDNGDNPPLELESFHFCHPVTRMIFKSPATTDLYLYYGNSVVAAPRYDVTLVAAQLLSADRAKAFLGPEQVLKKTSLGEGTSVSPLVCALFWLVLVMVVLVLLLVISRLLPRGQ